ncbi:hypothetical protein Hanom_Chr08g00689991 [Helianthus anomalus]
MEDHDSPQRNMGDNVIRLDQVVSEPVSRPVPDLNSVAPEVNNEVAVNSTDNGGTKDGNGIGLKKKGKGYRKKTRAQKSPSPTGQERPKKRAREGEDIFDLDRLIYNLNGEEAARLHYPDRGNNVEVSQNNVNNEQVDSRDKSTEDNVDMGIGDEVAETLKLGSWLRL